MLLSVVINILFSNNYIPFNFLIFIYFELFNYDIVCIA